MELPHLQLVQRKVELFALKALPAKVWFGVFGESWGGVQKMGFGLLLVGFKGKTFQGKPVLRKQYIVLGSHCTFKVDQSTDGFH